VHDDIQRRRAKIRANALGEAVDRKIADLLVTLVRAQLLRGIGERVERRVERIDPLERQQRTIGHAARLVHLSALEQVVEDVECRRPGGDAHRRPCLRERLRDGEAETAVVRHARDEGAAAGKIDFVHTVICPRVAEQASGGSRMLFRWARRPGNVRS
jgi:hypothetical protein